LLVQITNIKSKQVAAIPELKRLTDAFFFCRVAGVPGRRDFTFTPTPNKNISKN
jgi:hypothetical protein